jgi:hypothetical protein
MPQKTITETTPPTPKIQPQIIKPPVVTAKESVPPVAPVQQPKPPQPQTQTQRKPIPPEIKIIVDGIEEWLQIGYAMQQKLLQLYGPVEYVPITDIELQFSTEQARVLNFDLQGDFWIITVKHHLETEDFKRIANIVRGLGGEYISAGKDSHFKVKRA